MAKRTKKQRSRSAPKLPLFDLPLQAGAKPETAGPQPAGDLAEDPVVREGLDQEDLDAPPEMRAEAASQTLLFEAQQAQEDDVDVPREEDVDAPQEEETLAGWTQRLRAGVADLLMHLLVLAVAMTAAHRLGTDLSWSLWPPFAGLVLIFSFLYWMVPVAFWGQTPGMAWVGQATRGLDDEPLTFYQTFRRWLGALLTAALAGLPLLLSLGENGSLSDRLSASKTVAL